MNPSAYCEKKGSKCDCFEKENFKNKSSSKSKSSKTSNSNKQSFNFLENIHLFGGSVAQNICKEGDNSWYCGLSRFYSSVIMILSLIAIIFFIYMITKYMILPFFTMKPTIIKKNKIKK